MRAFAACLLALSGCSQVLGYVNMRATWFSMAACGFSSAGGWAAINFQ
ncbi:MAG: hypothetical protein IPM35_33915 [Myxococcales bacterium]|nr:hypothetical protein [Myxococcales bacterium]